jgi:hypothetical protein
MLSEQSKHNIEAAFYKVARTSLIRDSSDSCDIAPAADGQMGDPLGANLMLITISSFVFRLLIVFQVADNPPNQTYYVGGVPGRGLNEGFSEVANMCGGALSHELSHSLPHLAMSIPYTLSSQCIAFLGDLKPQYLSSYLITINESVKLRATLCMCCTAPLDVAAHTAQSADSSGELELF